VNERGCESKLFVVLSRVKTGKARHKIKNPTECRRNRAARDWPSSTAHGHRHYTSSITFLRFSRQIMVAILPREKTFEMTNF
jgi:hypothetical protein